MVHLYQHVRHQLQHPRERAAARPRGAARREALLEATLRIVADTGADAVTHRRVAEVAQLPLASTTYYFDSKEELLTAALELAAERDLARLHAIADDRRRLPASPDDAVAAAMGPSGDERTDPARGGRRSLLASYTLLLEAARRPALQALTRRWTEAYLTTIVRAAAARRLGRARRGRAGAAGRRRRHADRAVVDRRAAGSAAPAAAARPDADGVAEMSALRTRRAALRRDSQPNPERRLVSLIRVVLLFESALYSAVTPVLPHYAHTLHASKAAIGVLAAAYPAGLIPGAFLGFWVATRAGVRRTTVFGLVGFGLAVIAFGFGTSIVTLDVLRAIQGMFCGLIWCGGLTWVIHVTPVQRRSRTLGGRARRGDVRDPVRADHRNGRGRDRHPARVRARRPASRSCWRR